MSTPPLPENTAPPHWSSDPSQIYSMPPSSGDPGPSSASSSSSLRYPISSPRTNSSVSYAHNHPSSHPEPPTRSPSKRKRSTPSDQPRAKGKGRTKSSPSPSSALPGSHNFTSDSNREGISHLYHESHLGSSSHQQPRTAYPSSNWTPAPVPQIPPVPQNQPLATEAQLPPHVLLQSLTTWNAAGNGWTYRLEIIQQPQRARACGFGDKDRRPLSPPPIIKLWTYTSSGSLVNPDHVSIQFLVLVCDLWSADGHQQRDVVMHPTSAASQRPQSQVQGQDGGGTGQNDRPNTAHSSASGRQGFGAGAALPTTHAIASPAGSQRPRSRRAEVAVGFGGAHEAGNEAQRRPGSSSSALMGWTPEMAHRPAPSISWPYPSVLSPGPSPHSFSSREMPSPLIVPTSHQSVTGWPPPMPSRPATTRGTSFTRSNLSFSDPPRPLTAPYSQSAQRSNIALPPLSTITRPRHDLPLRLTLPALQHGHTARSASHQLQPLTHLPSLLKQEPDRGERNRERDIHTSSSAASAPNTGSTPIDHTFGRPGSSSSSAWYPPSMLSSSGARHSLSSVGSGSEILTPYREAGPPFERLHISDSSSSRPATSWDVRPQTADRERSTRGFSSAGILGRERDRPRTGLSERPMTAGSSSVSSPLVDLGGRRIDPRLKQQDQKSNYDDLSRYSFGQGVGEANLNSRGLELALPMGRVNTITSATEAVSDRSTPTGLTAHPTNSSTNTSTPTSGSSAIVLPGNPSAPATLSIASQPQPVLHTAPAPTANYSRVLVGSLCAPCQRLQDDQGQSGLFFFAHDLGEQVSPGQKAQVLAETYSDPFTVYSAKRFPGVIPTTALTRLFAKQNVRLPTRQRRSAHDAGDSDGDRAED